MTVQYGIGIVFNHDNGVKYGPRHQFHDLRVDRKILPVLMKTDEEASRLDRSKLVATLERSFLSIG
jgi:hypothetical protein